MKTLRNHILKKTHCCLAIIFRSHLSGYAIWSVHLKLWPIAFQKQQLQQVVKLKQLLIKWKMIDKKFVKMACLDWKCIDRYSIDQNQRTQFFFCISWISIWYWKLFKKKETRTVAQEKRRQQICAHKCSSLFLKLVN